MKLLKTAAAAKELGVEYFGLFNLIRFGKLRPPAKDTSGDYIWSSADLDRVRQVLAAKRKRRAKAVPA